MKRFRSLLTKIAVIATAGALLLPLGCGSAEDDSIIKGYVENSEIEEATRTEWIENADNGFANDTFPEGYESVAYPSLTELLLALENGEVDFISTTANTAQYICDTNEDYQIVKGDKKVYYEMAMLEENQELCDDINEAIEEIKTSVELYELIDTYITNYATAPSTKVESNPDWNTYKVGVSGNVPPLDYIDTDGTPSGFNVAILNLIGKKIGVNFEYVSLDANARTTALVSGNIDMIFCENITEDSDIAEFEFEDSKLLLTDYYYSDIGVWVTKDYPAEQIREIYNIEDTTIASLEDLAGKKVGVTANGNGKTIAEEKLTDSEIIPIGSRYDKYIALENGTVDAILGKEDVLASFDGVKIIDDPLESIECGLALSKDQTDLQEKMTNIIEQYQEDGTLEELQNKWLEADDLSDVTVDVDTDYKGTKGTLKVAVRKATSPHAYYYGEWKGYSYELAVMICKELGYQFEYVEYDTLGKAIDAVADGELDMLIGSITINPEREKEMLFVKNGITEEYYVGVLK